MSENKEKGITMIHRKRVFFGCAIISFVALTVAIIASNNSWAYGLSKNKADASGTIYSLTMDQNNKPVGSGNIVQTPLGNDFALTITGSGVDTTTTTNFLELSDSGYVYNTNPMQKITSLSLNFTLTGGTLYYKIGTDTTDSGLLVATSGNIYQTVDSATYFVLKYVAGTETTCTLNSVVVKYGCNSVQNPDLLEYGIGSSSGWTASYTGGLSLTSVGRVSDADSSTWTINNMTSLVMLKGIEFTYGIVEYDVTYTTAYQADRRNSGFIFGSPTQSVYYGASTDTYQCAGIMINNSATSPSCTPFQSGSTVGRIMNHKITSGTFAWGKITPSTSYAGTLNTTYHIVNLISSTGLITIFINGQCVSATDSSSYTINSANKYCGFLATGPGITYRNISIKQGAEIEWAGNRTAGTFDTATVDSVAYGSVNIWASRSIAGAIAFKGSVSTSWASVERLTFYFDKGDGTDTARTANTWCFRYNVGANSILDYFYLTTSEQISQTGISIASHTTTEFVVYIPLSTVGASDSTIGFNMWRSNTSGTYVSSFKRTDTNAFPSTTNPSAWVRISSSNSY